MVNMFWLKHRIVGIIDFSPVAEHDDQYLGTGDQQWQSRLIRY